MAEICRGGLVLAILLLTGCGAPPPGDLGPTPEGLAPCPDRPNCVHTGDRVPEDVEPLLLTDAWRDRAPGDVLAAVEVAAESLPGTRVLERGERYRHAESVSRIFRFVDDLEVYRAVGRPELLVRSASRVGRSDLGVNRRRVESLRRALQEAGVVR